MRQEDCDLGTFCAQIENHGKPEAQGGENQHLDHLQIDVLHEDCPWDVTPDVERTYNVGRHEEGEAKDR